METRIKKIDKEKLYSEESRRVIQETGEILKRGGLVAFPTETVYGLGAALQRGGARKIYEAKGRPSDNPLIVHIADMDSLGVIARDIPEIAFSVAERFWPGPLTMIFKKKEMVSREITGGLDTVAVRMPDALSREIIKAGGGFIAAPSANLSGKPSPTTAQHVLEDLDGRIDMVVDGGVVSIGVESTVLDLTVTPPMILRPGAVTKEMLEPVIGAVREDAALFTAGTDFKPKAPGMKYRHYAPEAKLSIVEGEPERVAEAINRMAEEQRGMGHGVGVIGTEETVGRYRADVVKSIGTRGDEADIARHLYGILREFDKEKVEYIYSEAFSAGGMGSAVMNRLLKAAGHHVIHV